LIAYDWQGNPRWQVPLPAPMVEFGTGTSPVLANGRVILVSDGDQGSYLLAVDQRTGRRAWRTERPEFRRSFSTPYLWQHDGIDELVVPGSIWLRAYDPKDGSERWSYTGTSRVANSTPCAGEGLLFSASWNIGADPGDRITLEPYEDYARANDANHDGDFSRDEIPAGPLRERFSQMDINKDQRVTRQEWGIMREMFAKAGNAVLAIRAGGRSDITDTHLAWKSTRSLPYVCSPVCYQGRLYTVKNGGLASCYEARTGRVLYQDERLDAPGDYYASLVAGGDKVIAISQKGVATILAGGDSLKILARNAMGAEVMATPALVQGTLYIRTADHLFAFGAP
jgi:outer membrane protein assembly factor BamB